ncbi:GPW/gp25 family protein [Marinagarivorans algicola]|nr:GPW/gp25 family protein [Marinagarivorans algicola]
MSALTGKRLSGDAHLDQSVRDILQTPIGSRVMRRTYGSGLFDLIDTPVNDDTRLDFVSATAEALRQWEPRIVVERVWVRAVTGGVDISVEGRRVIDNTKIHIESVQIR